MKIKKYYQDQNREMVTDAPVGWVDNSDYWYKKTEIDPLVALLAVSEMQLSEMAPDANEIASFILRFQDMLPPMAPVAAAQRLQDRGERMQPNVESIILSRMIKMGEESLDPEKFEWLTLIVADLRRVRKNIATLDGKDGQDDG